MDKKYYTVAEFAKIAGVSPQYVYKQINKQLRKYCKLVEGRKVISQNALQLFEPPKVNNSLETSLQPLLLQLQEKDVQIAQINEQLKVKDEQIARRDEQIAELTKAFREAQALHAGTMQRELTDNTTAKNKHRWWKFWEK